MEGEAFPMAQLTSIIGPQNAELCPALLHLTLADSAYSALAVPPHKQSNSEMGKITDEVEG